MGKIREFSSCFMHCNFLFLSVPNCMNFHLVDIGKETHLHNGQNKDIHAYDMRAVGGGVWFRIQSDKMANKTGRNLEQKIAHKFLHNSLGFFVLRICFYIWFVCFPADMKYFLSNCIYRTNGISNNRAGGGGGKKQKNKTHNYIKSE